MSAVAVDTSVLLVILKDEPNRSAWLDCLDASAESGVLLVSTVVVAEVRSFFSSDRDCLQSISDLGLRHSPLSEDTALLAGKLFRAYRDAGGPRKTILPDFLIAAHAARQARAFATLDRGFLRRYFPTLRLITPPSKN
jgi:predicted nucleic acid-binding protein